MYFDFRDAVEVEVARALVGVNGVDAYDEVCSAFDYHELATDEVAEFKFGADESSLVVNVDAAHDGGRPGVV